MRARFTFVALCSLLLLAAPATTATSHPAAARAASPESVVAMYFSIANSILKGGSVAQLATVIAPNATLEVSTPAGDSTVFHNLSGVETWYKAFAASHAGAQLKPVSMRSPLPGMVIHYEIAVDPTNTVKGRCAHIFAIANGMILRDDFIVYWGG